MYFNALYKYHALKFFITKKNLHSFWFYRKPGRKKRGNIVKNFGKIKKAEKLKFIF